MIFPISELSVFGSQVIIYYFSQFFLLLYLVIYFEKVRLDVSILYIFLFYLIIQVFVLSSIFFSPFEPTRGVRAIAHGSLSVLTYGLLTCVFYDSITSASRFIKALNLFLIVFSITSTFYLLIEFYSLFNESVESIVFKLYKNETEGILNSLLTSFFGQSYFAGFVFSQFFSVSMAFSVFGKRGFYFPAILFLFLTISTQSKTAIFSLIVSVFIIYFLKSPRRWFFVAFFLLFIGLLISSTVNTNKFESLINQSGSYFLKSSYRLMSSSNSSGTLNERMSQVEFALSLSEDRNWILGRGEVNDKYLESLPAKFIAKYGVLGFFFYVIGILIIVKLAFFKFFRSKRSDSGKAAIACGITLLMSFPLQMSSMMFNWSKPGIIFSLITAMTLFFLNKKCFRQIPKTNKIEL
jgi:hypothetical protein